MKKSILLYGVPVVVALILFLLIRMFDPFGYKFEEIGLDKYEQLNKSKGTEIVYIYDEKEDSGKVYSDIIKSVMEKQKTKLFALDYNSLKEEDIKKFINANSYTKTLADSEEGFLVPMVIYLKDGKVKASIMGTCEKKDFEKFIKDNGVR